MAETCEGIRYGSGVPVRVRLRAAEQYLQEPDSRHFSGSLIMGLYAPLRSASHACWEGGAVRITAAHQ